MEQFIKGKKPDENLCEDFLFYNENFIVVADGVTAKDTILFGGETGGRAAARMVCEAVSELRPDTDVFEAVEIMAENPHRITHNGNVTFTEQAEMNRFEGVVDTKEMKLRTIRTGDTVYIFS